jgi:biopolymer transport protein ExbB/TolQ
MLVSAFEGIDVSNISTVQNSLAQMASGMGTALYTTLVGLVSSLFIKFQLVNLENSRVTHGKS